MTTDKMDWVSIADFRAGIVHNLGYGNSGGALSGYGPGSNGMASMDGTYRCFALPSGALAPLPRRDWSLSFVSQGVGALVWRVQAHIAGPIWAYSPEQTTTVSLGNRPFDARDFATHRIEVELGMEATDGVAQRRARWNRLRVYAYGNIIDNNPTNKYIIESNADSTFQPTRLKYSPFWFVNARSATDNTLVQLYPLVVCAWGQLSDFWSSNPPNPGAFIVGFPVPTQNTSPSGTGFWDIATAAFNNSVNGQKHGPRIVAHQQRLLNVFKTVGSWEDRTNQIDSTDMILNYVFEYTIPGYFGQNDAVLVQFSEDTPGVGVVASLTASDLLYITYASGAYLVQGDLNTPIVRKLPGVTSTYGAECIGAQTPIGYVYGSNVGGVHVWGGGDESQPLAPQLPPDFWLHPDSVDILNYRGKFAFFDHFLLVPNNWCYDIATQGWFRWEDPGAFNAYEWMIDPLDGYIYGNTPKWTDAGSGMMSGYFQGWNPTLGANSYSWRSLPIFLGSHNRFVTVREIDLTVQGTGNVVFIIENSDGTTQAEVLTLDPTITTAPQIVRAVTEAKNTDQIRLRIIATGAGNNPAPIIYKIELGVIPREHVSGSQTDGISGPVYGYGVGFYGDDSQPAYGG